jgi:hypothetical protein
VLADGDRVWVAVVSSASVIAFDPETLLPITVVDLPRQPVDLAVVSERLMAAGPLSCRGITERDLAPTPRVPV